jgi:hypothetical protein
MDYHKGLRVSVGLIKVEGVGCRVRGQGFMVRGHRLRLNKHIQGWLEWLSFGVFGV